jgi:hypothetical protein
VGEVEAITIYQQLIRELQREVAKHRQMPRITDVRKHSLPELYVLAAQLRDQQAEVERMICMRREEETTRQVAECRANTEARKKARAEEAALRRFNKTISTRDAAADNSSHLRG